MKKIKYITDTAFHDVINNELHADLINIQKDNNIPELSTCIKQYKKLIKNNKSNLNAIALIEETIIQLRCKDTIDGNIKFSVVRDYIYARAPFILKGKKLKDIRVIVGKTSVFGTDTVKMEKDKNLLEIAYVKLQTAMTDVINENLKQIDKLKL